MNIFRFVLLSILAPGQSLAVVPRRARTPLGHSAAHEVHALVNDTVVLRCWYGRLGNHIIQMVNAIIWGSIQGAKKVRFPAHGAELFDLPPELEILDVGANLSQREAQCVLAGGLFFSRCSGVTKALFRDVAVKHLRPHLTPRTREACERESGIAFDGLTVHLRGGDAMTITTRQGMLAPCAYILRVVHTHKFARVRLVTQDRGHPCVASLRERLPEESVSVQVQAGTLEEDACALMSARNLALLSASTFSQALELLSDQPGRTFVTFSEAAVLPKVFDECRSFEFEPEGALQAPRHATFWYEISGLEVKAPGATRLSYLMSGGDPVRRIMTCDSDYEVPFYNSFR